MLSLKTMTESKLKVLKREVEAALQAKVAARRQEIESELSRLSLLDGSARAKVVRAARGMDAAKYRNSASPRKAAGRKLNESLITDSPKVSTSAKQPKKARKINKVRNDGEIAQAVILTSIKTEVVEPLCPEPLDTPLPVESLSDTLVHPNNNPGDLGGDTIAPGAP